MNSPDTYCGLIAGVVCKSCPLAKVSEKAWSEAVQPGITPFDAALDVGRAVLNVCDELHDEQLDLEQSFEDLYPGFDELPEPTPEDLYEESRGERMLGMLVGKADVSTMIRGLQIVTLKTNAVQTLEDRKAPPRKLRSLARVIKSLGACAESQASRECTITETIEQASDTIVPLQTDREMGANVLEIMARHSGGLVEIRQMCQRIHDVLEDAKARLGLREKLIDFGASSEAECRAYLMIEAERLRSGLYGGV